MYSSTIPSGAGMGTDILVLVWTSACIYCFSWKWMLLVTETIFVVAHYVVERLFQILGKEILSDNSHLDKF